MAAVLTAVRLAPALPFDGGVTGAHDARLAAIRAFVELRASSERAIPPIGSSALEGDGAGGTKLNGLRGGGGEGRLELVDFAPEDRTRAS